MQKISNTLSHGFPTYGEKNIAWFYLVSIFGNGWFQIGNWLLFVLLFMTEREFAVYESIAFAMGIFLEIPSGAFADLLGKKRTVIIGLFMQAFGSYLFIFGYLGKPYFFFGNIIIIMAFALISGSLEALAYDTLVQKKKTEFYDDVIGKGRSLEILSMVVAGLVGGVAWKYSIYAPLVLTAISFSVAFLMSFKFKEPLVDTEIFSFKNFVKQNRRGFYYLFRSDFRKYTFSFALITGSYLMFAVGIVRVLMGRDFGYDGETLNYLVSATLLAGFFASYFFRTVRRKLGDLYGFSSLLLLAGVAWLVSGFFTNSLLLGALVFTVITVTGTLSEAWTSVILNKHVLSKDRATAISTLSFFVQIPYVVVVVLFGNLVADSNAGVFYIVIGVLLLIGLLSFYRAEKSNILVKKAPNI